MCCLSEYVSEITNPFGLMRDCLLFFFSFLYCHSCSCLCAFFNVSNVNLSCKKKRKYLRTVLMIFDLLAKARLWHRVLPPCMFESETKIMIITRAKKIANPRTQEHFFVLCVSAFRNLPKRDPGHWNYQLQCSPTRHLACPLTHLAPPTPHPHPQTSHSSLFFSLVAALTC